MKNNKLVLMGIVLFTNFFVGKLDYSFGQSYPGMAKSFHKITLSKEIDNSMAPTAQEGKYTTYSYTFADLIIFSYFDGTQFDVLNTSGSIVASGSLNANSFRTITPGAGTYGVRSSKPFAMLIGDPVSRSVLGYFAADERGKGVSTKLLTYMPKDEYGPERFLVFAYNNGTQVQIKNLSTNTVVWSGILNAGEHFISSGLESTFLQVSASAGISALSYTDQGYLVPTETGDWVGRLFYGYAGLVGGWSEDLNLISFESGVQITVKNSQTGGTIWTGTLNKGELKSLTITSSNTPETFFEIQATGRISASVSPYTAYTQGYYHLTGCADESGTMIGNLFYVPAINGGRFDFSSFEDNNVVTIKRLDTGATAWSGTLNAGQQVSLTTARALYEVVGTGKLTGVESFGGSFGGEFRPVFYGIDLPDLSVTSSGMTVDPEFADAGNPVNLQAIVNNLGTQTASLVTVAFYDGDPLQGGKRIGQPYQIAQIAAGAQATASAGWTVPENPGYHRLFVVVDENNAIDESNESNNKAERSFYPNNELEPPLALTIDAPQGLSVDANGNYLPDPFFIRATISNNGNLTCANISATLELPAGLVLSSGQPTVNVGSLVSGQSMTVTWPVHATGNPYGDLIYRVLLSSGACGSKEGKRLIRVPEAPFAADLTATWNGQRTDDVEIYVDRGNGFPATPEGKIISANTPLRVTGLSVGNKLRAVKKVHEKEAERGDHEAVNDIMFELWADSDAMQEARGDYDPFEITSRQSNFELDIVHVIYKYNLVVSMERDNIDNDYFAKLEKGFKKASRYLYNATDGQVMFNKIVIYDGKNHWSSSDMQIYRDHWPEATIDGIDNGSTDAISGGHIYFGETILYPVDNKFYYPTDLLFYSAIAHEFSHYAFGVRDEYKDGTGDQGAWQNYRLKHPKEVPHNYGVMDHPQSITEFSSANDYLKSYPTNLEKRKVNWHYYIKNKPTWNVLKEKLEGYFSDVNIKLPPPGYYPDGPQHDRLGPNYQSIELETSVLDLRAQSSIASANNHQVLEGSLDLRYGAEPLPGALVYLLNNKSKMYIGTTDALGRIDLPSFQKGAEFEIFRLMRKGLLRAQIQIAQLASACKISLGVSESSMFSSKTLLQDRGFVFASNFSLSGSELTFNLLLYVDGALSGNPKVKLLYGTTADSTTLTLSGTNKYTGQLKINTQTPNFDGTGTFEISATATSGEQNRFPSSFRMFYLQRNEFPEAFVGKLDINFSPENLSTDQFGMMSGTYARPFLQSGVNLYPVSAMYNVNLEREATLAGGAAINIHYLDSEVHGLDESTLAIFHWDESTKSWTEILESKTDVDDNVVSALIDRTGSYVVFAKVSSGDVTPPGRINDLGASTGAGQGKVELQWTAPGDDDFTGTATSYVIRFNEVPISHLNWESSTTISNLPQPVASGSKQAVTVRVPLSNKLYYFAMKTRDEAGNESELSNNASAISGIVETPPDTNDCSTTFTDDFSAGEGNWAPNTPTQWSITYFGGDPAFCVSVPDPVGDEYALQRGNPWLDFDLEMDAQASASSNKNFFVLFGAADYNNATSNGYYLQFALGGVKLYRSINGSGIPIASSAGDFVNDNAFHHLRVERHAPNIKAYADGILLIDVNDDMFVIGSIGFGSYMSTACFDDVHISGTQSNQGPFADYFDDYNANGWTPLNPGRWQVVAEGISPRYFLNTTNYDSPDGLRLGEYSLISGQTWGDFTFECLAKSLDAAQSLENADLCIVFGYQDANNYYYAMYNRAEGLSGIHRIQGGARTTLATYSLRTFDDGNYHQLRVERTSSQIDVFFDGNRIASAFDNTFGDGQIGVGSFNDAGYFDNVTISGGCTGAPPPPPTVLATATIPSGQTVAAGNTLAVPIRVTTAKNIGVAQFTIEYDGNDLLYNGATVGSEAPGFSISQQNPNPSFGPTTPGTNRNLIVQISGGGTNTFSGTDRTVVILHFTAIGVLGADTPLAFDHDCSHTFLSTPSFEDICGSQITFNNGDARITVAPQISGTVRYYSAARPISNTTVALAGAAIANQTTDANGIFNFTGLSAGNYTLTPSKSDDIRGAITGSDAIKVLQAVAFVISLTPDEALAADVDENSAVTGADAVAVLRYLAFLPSGTANTGKWKFSPTSYSISLTTNETRDFRAFLLGEVTGNWGSTAPLAAASSPVNLEVGMLKRSNGSLRIPLRVPTDVATIYTMTSTLHHSFVSAKVFQFEPAVDETYFAINYASEGKMHMALARLKGFAPGSLIGELVCDLPENNNADLNEKEVIGEFVDLYLNDVAVANVMVQNIATSTAIPEEYTLLQNYPNPFNAGTTIRFAVPKTGEKTELSLEIYSLNGQKIRTLYRGQPTAGYHTQVWDGRDDRDRVVGSGVYLYRLTAGEFVAKRKLLLLK